MEMLQQRTQIDHSLLERFGVKFRKNTKARSIFHYTSIGGLKGILSSKKLRFTNIKYMNDKDEIVAGLDSMVKALGVPEEDRERLRAAFLHHRTQPLFVAFPLKMTPFRCGATIQKKSTIKAIALSSMIKS